VPLLEQVLDLVAGDRRFGRPRRVAEQRHVPPAGPRRRQMTATAPVWLMPWWMRPVSSTTMAPTVRTSVRDGHAAAYRQVIGLGVGPARRSLNRAVCRAGSQKTAVCWSTRVRMPSS
jgi:hypothetical protein